MILQAKPPQNLSWNQDLLMQKLRKHDIPKTPQPLKKTTHQGVPMPMMPGGPFGFPRWPRFFLQFLHDELVF